MFDKYQGAIKIGNASVDDTSLKDPYFGGEKLKRVACGKFHSLFLTESGKVFAVGFNKYG